MFILLKSLIYLLKTNLVLFIILKRCLEKINCFSNINNWYEFFLLEIVESIRKILYKNKL
jgi:hypothetical protein